MPQPFTRTITSSFEETQAIGHTLACRLLSQLNPQRAIVVLLRGDLGAGKTVFARGFLSAFGVRRVLSPTFTLMRRYRLRTVRGENINIYHIDGYRLQEKDAAHLLLQNIVQEPRAILLIEWPGNLGHLKWDAIVDISHRKNENEREIRIKLRA